MISLEQIAKAVRDGKQERERAIRTLAGDKGLQAKVKAMVLAKGGTKEDALTVYSDTIVAFVKRIIKEPALTISVPLSTYLVGVARYKWYDLLQAQGGKLDIVDVSETPAVAIQPQQYQLLLRSDKWQLLEKVLGVMATRCKEVLMLWSGGHSMKEIALELGYKSDGMARKKKSECMKQLLLYLGQHPYIKEQLR